MGSWRVHPVFIEQYHDYYKTPRGYHPRSLNSTDGWTAIGCQSFLNQPLMAYANEIEGAVLPIHGSEAHSRYFSEDTYQRLTGENKKLMIIPGAVHVDLYDNYDYIPFDTIEAFYTQYLGQ